MRFAHPDLCTRSWSYASRSKPSFSSKPKPSSAAVAAGESHYAFPFLSYIRSISKINGLTRRLAVEYCSLFFIISPITYLYLSKNFGKTQRIRDTSLRFLLSSFFCSISKQFIFEYSSKAVLEAKGIIARQIAPPPPPPPRPPPNYQPPGTAEMKPDVIKKKEDFVEVSDVGCKGLLPCANSMDEQVLFISPFIQSHCHVN